MSLIEKLDGVLAAVSPLSSKSTPTDVMRASAKALDLLRDHGPAIRQAMIDAERFKAYRDATFDGHAVYAHLDERAKLRTSAENVADVLDALNRVARLASDSEGPEADSGGDRG